MQVKRRHLALTSIISLLLAVLGGLHSCTQSPKIQPRLPQPAGGVIAQPVYNAITQGGCKGDGVTDDTAALRTAWTAAQAANLPLYLPAGTYSVNFTTGDLFAMTVDGGRIFGDGKNLTNIVQASGATLTGSPNFFHMQGRNQRVSDLFINGNNPTGSGSQAQTGIWMDAGCFDSLAERCEIVGIYGAGTAGGTGISETAVWNQYARTPQIGTTVSGAGLLTVTPSSLYGFSPGRRVDVDTGVTSTVWNGVWPNANKVVALAAQPQAAGTGYVIGDVVSTSGGTGSQGTFYVGALRTVSVASVVAGGSGYGTNDLIVVNGGTISTGPLGTPTVLKVTNQVGGVIQAGGLSIQTAGSYFTTPGAGTLTTTAQTGSGTGATVTLTYSADQLGALTYQGVSSIAAGGTNYAYGDIVPLSGGTSGIPALFLVTSVSGGVVNGIRQIHPGTYSASAGTAAIATGTALNYITGAASSGSGLTLNLNTPVFQNGLCVTASNLSAQPANPVTMTGGTGSSLTCNVMFGPENIIVLGTTATTFTAYYQLAHSSSAYLGVIDRGTGEHNVFRDIYIHNCLNCTGIGGTGKGALFDNIRVVDVGNNTTSHGVYWQGSNGIFRNCWFEGCRGFSIQLQQSQPNGDGSFNQVIGCVSVNPGTGHLVVNAASSPSQISNSFNYQTNQDVQLGASLIRAATVTGCTFRMTRQQASQQGATVASTWPGQVLIQSLSPVDVINNRFEDSYLSINSTSSYSKAIGNKFFLSFADQGSMGTQVLCSLAAPYCIAESNSFENAGLGTNINGAAINVGATGCIARGNQIVAAANIGSAASLIFIGGNNAEIASNIITAPTGGTGCYALKPNTGVSGVKIHDNIISLPSSSAYALNEAGAWSGAVYNNDWSGTGGGFRFAVASIQTGLIMYNNDGGISFGGTTFLNLTRDSGALLQAITGTGGTTAGKIVKYDGSGNVIAALTSDTSCAGIAASTNAASSRIMVAGQAGTKCPVVVEAAGGVTIGNLCIMSTTTAATIHDTGSQVTIPASGFLCRALTTTAANGTATVEVIRLQ